jgi:hypothetical protein
VPTERRGARSEEQQPGIAGPAFGRQLSTVNLSAVFGPLIASTVKHESQVVQDIAAQNAGALIGEQVSAAETAVQEDQV